LATKEKSGKTVRQKNPESFSMRPEIIQHAIAYWKKIPVPEHVPENTAHHCNQLIHQTRFQFVGFFGSELRQRILPTVTQELDGMQIPAFTNLQPTRNRYDRVEKCATRKNGLLEGATYSFLP